jgi:hypothetical protein
MNTAKQISQIRDGHVENVYGFMVLRRGNKYIVGYGRLDTNQPGVSFQEAVRLTYRTIR